MIEKFEKYVKENWSKYDFAKYIVSNKGECGKLYCDFCYFNKIDHKNRINEEYGEWIYNLSLNMMREQKLKRILKNKKL